MLKLEKLKPTWMFMDSMKAPINVNSSYKQKKCLQKHDSKNTRVSMFYLEKQIIGSPCCSDVLVKTFPLMYQ